MKKTSTTILALAGLLAAASASHAQVTVPYSNDFESGAGSFSAASPWTVSGGAFVGSFGGQFSNSMSFANVQATSLGAASVSSFTVEADFTVSGVSLASNGTRYSRVGLSLFADSGAASTATTSYPNISQYVAYIATSSSASTGAGIVIAQVTAGATSPTVTTLATGSFSNTYATDGSIAYNLSATGTYSGGLLDLTFTVSDGVNSVGITAFDLTPLAGEYFGFFGARARTAVTFNADDFAIGATPVPEPSAFAALAGLAAVGFAATRRRRCA